jgi:type IV conjugative transfer system protein TraL
MYPVPRYPNDPLTFIGMEMDEVVIGFLGLFYAFAVKKFIVFLLVVGAVYLYVKAKRKYPPGFLKHGMYMVSMFELDYYPDCQRQLFIE